MILRFCDLAILKGYTILETEKLIFFSKLLQDYKNPKIGKSENRDEIYAGADDA